MPDYNLTDLFDSSSPYYNGALRLPTPPGAKNTSLDAVNPATLNAGELQGNTILEDGYIKSSNYVAGVSGWYLDPVTGEFNFAVSVDSLDIPDTVTANSFHVDTLGNTWWGATTFGAAVASISKAGAAIFNSVSIPGYTLTNKGTFGGNGADGALAITSGTTTISCASVAVLTKNYTSISITGTGTLAFSNPHTNGTAIVLKSQGAVTLTSSSAPMIDASGIGAAGGVGGANDSSSSVVNGTIGSDGNSFTFFKTNAGAGGADASGTGGAAASTFTVPTIDSTLLSVMKYFILFVGAGGGGGGATVAVAGVGPPLYTGGTGGRGGGGLVIECAGAWNFTTASGISVAGLVGGNGATTNWSSNGSGSPVGAGGGAGGFFLGLYNTLTANSGTVTITGGTGGNNDSVHWGAAANLSYGGGGGASTAVGSNGTENTNSGGKSGGNGAAGVSVVMQNVTYA